MQPSVCSAVQIPRRVPTGHLALSFMDPVSSTHDISCTRQRQRDREALEVALLLRSAGDEPPTARAVGMGVLAVLRSCLAAGPLLIAVDDAQWLDQASLEALVFALRRVTAGPLSLLLAARADAPADPLTAGAPSPPRGWRDLLTAPPDAEEITLAPRWTCGRSSNCCLGRSPPRRPGWWPSSPAGIPSGPRKSPRTWIRARLRSRIRAAELLVLAGDLAGSLEHLELLDTSTLATADLERVLPLKVNLVDVVRGPAAATAMVASMVHCAGTDPRRRALVLALASDVGYGIRGGRRAARPAAISADNCHYPLRHARISADNAAAGGLEPGAELSG
jgi:hypothetical protein